jgi:hypothetical protein
MSDRRRRFGEDPETPEPELASIAERLAHGRPNPRPTLRHSVRAVLPSRAPIGRPPQLWLRVALFVATGAALLVLVAAGLANSGPLAA